MELGWIDRNPAKDINPATNELSILFTDFMLDIKNTVKKHIVPCFLDKKYKLIEIEENPKYIQDYYSHELSLGLSTNTVIHRHVNIRKAL